MLRRAWMVVRAHVLRGRLEREMRTEMAEHLERAEAQLVRRGMSPSEARQRARREFGNLAYLQEEARYARGTVWLETVAADARYATRQFARRPFTTAAMLLVLTLGLAISTLLFTFVHAYATLPPAGMTAAPDLVRIRGTRDAGVFGRAVRTFGEAELRAYTSLGHVFREVTGWMEAAVPVRRLAGARSEEANATFVTGDYFGVMGVRPVLGRALTPADGRDQANVAVLGHRGWQLYFDARPDVLGRTISVHGVPVTIVGVAPERFDGIGPVRTFHLWLPLEARSLIVPRGVAEYRAAARLQPGITHAQATQAVRLVSERAAEQDGASAAEAPAADVVPLLSANGDPMFDRDVRLLTLALGLLGTLVLLVTCTNVSALLTGLAAARRHEIAVRLSLGAARTRVLRQLITESATLAALAGAVALAVVWGVLQAAMRYASFLPFELRVHWGVIAFTFGVALAAGVLFGISPALHATRLAVASALRDATGTIVARRARLQRALVVAQIAFTQPLMVMLAGTLVLVLTSMQQVSRSADAERIITIRLQPVVPLGQAAAAPGEELRAHVTGVAERLRETPGVTHVVPDRRGAQELGAYAEAGQGAADVVQLAAARVAPDYFAVLGMRTVRGRNLEPEDQLASGTRGGVPAVVSKELAMRLWPGSDPVGRTLVPASDSARAAGAPLLEVIGVVEDPQATLRQRGAAYAVYLPPDPVSPVPLELLVRTGPEALAVLPSVRKVVDERWTQGTARVRTLVEAEAIPARHFRIVTRSLSGAGLAALLLSAFGLYAVVAFSVSQRLGEIAVRLAVGARRADIARQYLADGVRLGLFGMALGLPASLLGLRFLMQTFEVYVSLAPVAAITTAAVLIVAFLAALAPAQKAAGVDPAVTLRAG